MTVFYQFTVQFQADRFQAFKQIFKTSEKSVSCPDIFTKTIAKNFFQPERHRDVCSISSISSIVKMRLHVMHER